jgi:hypothetical protein
MIRTGLTDRLRRGFHGCRMWGYSPSPGNWSSVIVLDKFFGHQHGGFEKLLALTNSPVMDFY